MAASDMSFLDNLNSAQREAVEYIDGPSLVIAGAGSGKTMVLTYKIAYLLKKGIRPERILALTFTNKAAREMKERIATMVGELETQMLWMGTFHSIFNRILHKEARLLGYSPQYTIYQPSDSKSLIKTIIKEMGLDDKTYKPSVILNRISEAKNALITAQEYMESPETRQRDSNANMPQLAGIYNIYCMRCRKANAMDFDDLLLNTYILFHQHPEVLNRYAERFEYILVDEYQDTNFAQHQILIKLAQLHEKICVVGDDAQSIYSFRGANIDNILQFSHLYRNTKLFKLEQNYRSTQVIVGAANSIISQNKRQIPKKVYSNNAKGELISIKKAFSDTEEGEIVCNEISRLIHLKHLSCSQIAILYRTNAQSRIFEEALRKKAIPYRIYGGFSFYDQKIIKDVLAYFRLVVNPNDEEALKRIINFPARGIGDVTVRKIITAASLHEVGVWDILSRPDVYSIGVNTGTQKKLAAFHQLISSFINSQENAYTLGVRILKESGIMGEAYKDASVESKEMQDNLSEMLNAINTFVDNQREEGNDEDTSLLDYLSEVSLLSDIDESQKGEEKDVVTLMTVHASKGLEFDIVFIVGMEEELFPNQMATISLRELEEERRLFYVALTRSKTKCYLSCAKSRFRFGQIDFYQPSRFLKEIDSKYIQEANSEYSQQSNTSVFKNRITTNWGIQEVNTEVNRPKTFTHISTTEETDSETLASVMIQGQRCKAGTIVEHARFGEGKITALAGSEENATATIIFRNVGEKKLLLKYAKLTVKTLSN